MNKTEIMYLHFFSYNLNVVITLAEKAVIDRNNAQFLPTNFHSIT